MMDWKPIETARAGVRVEGLRVDGKGTVVGRTPRASSVAPIGRNVVIANGGMRYICSHWRPTPPQVG